ncbi:MAG: hypothetical protein HY898_10100 [Deltaproteobacteria bacterium]|nr:hypothetical protein [Deltaproteobacteria bacterium]
MALVGIWERPFIDVEPFVDTAAFDAIHEEVCLALANVQVSYTGGSHKTMGIVPPALRGDAFVDYGEVLRAMSDAQFEQFCGLADEPAAIDPRRRAELEFGEERSHPLSRRQMLYLKFRFGVYFPWKVYYELVPNAFWSEKSSSEGKDFTEEARRLFPRTVSFVQSLPFESIGSCKLLGLEANDHGTIHRDADPAEKLTVDHFITFCPRGDKRLYLLDEAANTRAYAPSRAYWFNDSDYHGVEPDPFFRYSIRVDGVFQREFLEKLLRINLGD